MQGKWQFKGFSIIRISAYPGRVEKNGPLYLTTSFLTSNHLREGINLGIFKRENLRDTARSCKE
jgi:hypothetical protein